MKRTKDTLRIAREYAREHRRKQRWLRAVTVLAAVVVFCTTYALILPAITLERQCDIPEHTHTDACYTQVTSREKKILACQTEADVVVHEHDSACYDSSGRLICTLEEVEAHQHSDSCYEAHTHTDACYTLQRGALTCTESTEPAHQHTDACYEESSVLICGEDHEHGEGCYETQQKLVCGLTEEPAHVHTDDCYAWERVLTCGKSDGEPQLVCGKEEVILHTHAPYVSEEETGCYDAKGENLICGKQQVVAHQHTSACFRTETEPVDTGTLTCTQEHEHTARCYGQWELTCGMEEHTHSDSCVSAETEDPGVFTYEDDTLEAMVILPEDSGVPAKAELRVTALTADSEGYAELAAQAEAAVGGNAEQVLLYDIGFYVEDETGERHLDVSDSATVSLAFYGPVLSGTGDGISVIHFAGEAQTPVRLENVTVTQQEAALYALTDEEEAGEEEAESGTILTFETDGFSVFAVVKVGIPLQEIPVTDDIVSDLDEKSYAIINYQSNRYMSNRTTEVSGETGTGIYKPLLSSVTDWTTLPKWTFTKNVDDSNNITYFIHCGDQYLKLDDTSGSISLVSVNESPTSFTVTADDNMLLIKYGSYYINNYRGADTEYFYGYQTLDLGCHLRLYQADETRTNVSDLGGKSFAIYNEKTYVAMTANEMTVDGAKGLGCTSATLITIDEVDYVYGSNIATWKFNTTGTQGVYTISTVTDDGTKYLNLTTSDNGDLTLSDTPQNITVTAPSDGNGKVLLSAGGGYINSSGSSSGNFWVYSGSGDNSRQTLCQVTSIPGNLVFDLNLPVTGSWITDTSGNTTTTQPSISDDVVTITDGMTLPTVAGTRIFDSFVFNSLSAGARSDAVKYYKAYNEKLEAAGALTADNYLAPGREYRFDGWQAVVHDETLGDITYTFPEGAEVSLLADGSIQITDTTNTVQTLPGGTVLTGKWTLRSDVVIFFVNFGDTMLEQQDNKEISGYNPNYYTADIVVGHIYNPNEIAVGKVTVNDKQKDAIVKANDAIIQSEISPSYNPSNSNTQVVIDAVRVFPADSDEESDAAYVAFSGINQTAVETKVGDYIRANPNQDKQIKIEKVTVDKNKINSNNYKLYWYLQKNVDDNDGWHIDGVLVAKTQEMEVYKTFSGLEAGDVTSIMTSTTPFQFQLGLIQSDGSQKYIQMTPATNAGVYSYDGKQGDSQIYKWTLNAIQGQEYTFTEQNYGLSDYDCSELVSVHYADGTLKWLNNSDTTWDWTKNTDLFGKAIKGGEATSVIFANFYTLKNTGALSICKLAEDNKTKLAGARFTLSKALLDASGNLQKENGAYILDPSFTTIQQTTNSNGSAYFSDLEEGSYILKETAAPSGYVRSDHTWIVVVTQTSTDGEGNTTNSDVVTVTVTEEDKDGNIVMKDAEGNTTQEDPLIVYQTGAGITNYEIVNSPESSTLTITKHFSGLTTSQMAGIYSSSTSTAESPYCIDVTGIFGTDTTETTQTLYLSTATQLTGGMAYQWTLTGLTPGGSYTITEHNYRNSNYLDTVVQGSFSYTTQSGETTETKTETLDVTKTTTTTDGTTASMEVTKTASADSVDITNKYTNTFKLQLQKVDDDYKPLQGAVFNIYGPYNDGAAQVPSGVSPTITYVVNGARKTAYYIGQTTPSGTDGIAVYDGLKLSTNDSTFVYVLDEFHAPAGYIKLEKPIVQEVKIDTKGYVNGVFTMQVGNTNKLSVTATKDWSGLQPTSDTRITLNLYRKAGDAAAKQVGSVVIKNGARESFSGTYEPTVENWAATWSNLPAYLEKTEEDGSTTYTPYVYYVAETPVAGFATSYSTAVSTLNLVGGGTVTAALAKGTGTTRSVTVTNTSTYELPQTGGGGTSRFVLGGLALSLSACLLLLVTRRRRRKGDAVSS